MTSKPSIQTRDLVCGYGSKAILRDVNLELPQGAITCVLGRSGCGKSTLLRTLLLLEPPLQGSIRFGETEAAMGDVAELEALRRDIGVLFQGAALFNSMDLLDNVMFPLREREGMADAEARELAMLKLDLVGLARYAYYLPSSISGGMRKRCGIARALATDPLYLFLDEPSAGLDPVTCAEVDRLMIDIRDQLGTTVIVVTHELLSINRIADHLVMVGQGTILASGPTDAVRSGDVPAVREFFAGNPAPPDPVTPAGLATLLLPPEDDAG